MFELFVLCCLLLGGWIFFSILLGVFKLGFWALTLPLKLLAGLLGLIFVLVIALPLGLLAGVLGLLAAPFALLLAFSPFLLIAFGVYLLIKR